MICRLGFLTFLTLIFSKSFAQLVAGPMLGPVELRQAKVWVGFGSQDDKAELSIQKAGEIVARVVQPESFSKFEFHGGVFTIGGLEPSTTYEYKVTVKDARTKVWEKKGRFTTKSLFQWRTPAPDFSFLAGSCAYFNEPRFDRPGRAYGMDTSIFETMALEKAEFMLWLGDNWYTREADYQSE